MITEREAEGEGLAEHHLIDDIEFEDEPEEKEADPDVAIYYEELARMRKKRRAH